MVAMGGEKTSDAVFACINEGIATLPVPELVDIRARLGELP